MTSFLGICTRVGQIIDLVDLVEQEQEQAQEQEQDNIFLCKHVFRNNNATALSKTALFQVLVLKQQIY
jgi:hypothetical protein